MRQVQNMMEFLRKKTRLVKQNNLKVNDWVEGYLEGCFLNGTPINILTQWCLSRSLKKRYEDRGGRFVPAKKEIRVVQTEIPEIISMFIENGFRINWMFTFNRAFLDTGLVSLEIERQYKEMIMNLANIPLWQENTLFFDWEKDFLGTQPVPDKSVLENYFNFVPRAAFELRLKQMAMWAEREAGLAKTQAQLQQDIISEAAFEAEEAKTLSGEKSPFGKDDFIIIPLEVAERYDNFTISIKDFKKRLVCALTTYPWRIKSE